jgi:hypothetical protein
MNERVALPPTLERISKIGPALAVLGLIGFGGGLAYVGSSHWAQFYLYAWLIGMGYTLGCYGLMLLHYVVKGSWGYPVIRIWEAGARLLPFMAVLALPLCFATSHLYPWAQAHITDPTVLHRAAYMNSASVLIRAIIYFAIWIGSTYFLTGVSRRLDDNPDVDLLRMRTNISSFLGVVFVLSVNFAYTDWVMSLETHWYSTIFGLWFVVSQVVCGVGLVTIITMLCRNDAPYKQAVDKGVRKDFGNLFLLTTMLWGYFSFSQWVIIWSGNLPDEIEFYLHRFSGSWLYVGAFIVVFQFFGPFVALLSGKTKNYPILLGGIATWLLIMRLVDIGWTIFPSFDGRDLATGILVDKPSSPIYIVIGAMLVVAFMGVWLTLLVQQLRGAQLTTSVIPETSEEALSHA